MFILGVDVGIKEVDILCQFSMVKGLCTVNVAWEEQANGPEGAYCRVVRDGELNLLRRELTRHLEDMKPLQR